MNQFSSQWKRRALSGAWKLLLILAGNTLYALAVALFVLPTGLITGGTTGLGLVAQNYLHIPLSAFVAVFNPAMFFVGSGEIHSPTHRGAVFSGGSTATTAPSSATSSGSLTS